MSVRGGGPDSLQQDVLRPGVAEDAPPGEKTAVLLARLTAEADDLSEKGHSHAAQAVSLGSLGAALRSMVQGEVAVLPRGACGQKVGQFVLREQLGEGGFGEVWSAWDTELERVTALKLLSLRPGDVRGLAVLQNELRASAAIDHPNVVRLRGTGATDEPPLAFIEMELSGDPHPTDPQRVAAATSLLRWTAVGRCTPREAARIICEAARGLAAAHALGVIHGDVAPGNILLSPAGRVQVADFGLARRAVRSGSDDPSVSLSGGGGTLPYMSPAVAAGAMASERSDLYGLGGVLIFLLGGLPPFARTPGESIKELRARVADGRDDHGLPPAITGGLRRICERMRAGPDQPRYASAAVVVGDLEAWLSYRTAPTVGPGGPSETARNWLVREDRLRQARMVYGLLMGAATLFHAGTFLVVAADGLAGSSTFGRYGPDALKMREILWMTAAFTLLGAYATWSSLSSRRVGRMLAVLLFDLGWLVAVLARWMPFDAGGLLKDPGALNTMYSFWLAVGTLMLIGLGLGLTSRRLRAANGLSAEA